MTLIDLDDIEEGMQLASDVVTDSGRRLLCAGARLTRRHLQLLAANGIRRLEVGQPRPATPPPGTPAVDPERLEALLAARFANTDPEQPLIRELQRICRKRWLGEGAEHDD
ncbi:hypothetical protein QVG61_12685 [Thiohalobacter sp. IOR34]|uniref:hypothetical protein n=1 Tax=Thiohalobacter sp. IOR34 TaxID=3057176 RepID=UPI0025AF026E|nr:hypothetical protein [Thiohalobacter sp. IOR34]WJW75328.1 hypothetical protein QVG61_12685 [Thiohalobacter sp. IOR34]